MTSLFIDCYRPSFASPFGSAEKEWIERNNPTFSPLLSLFLLSIRARTGYYQDCSSHDTYICVVLFRVLFEVHLVLRLKLPFDSAAGLFYLHKSIWKTNCTG